MPEGHNRLRKKIRTLILRESEDDEAAKLAASLSGTGGGGVAVQPKDKEVKCLDGTSGDGCIAIGPDGMPIPTPLPTRVEKETAIPEKRRKPKKTTASRPVVEIEKIINVARPTGNWENVQRNHLYWQFIDSTWNPEVHGKTPWNGSSRGTNWASMSSQLEEKGITGFTARPAGALKFIKMLRDNKPFSGVVKKSSAPEGPKDLLGRQQTGKRKSPTGLVTIVKDDGMIYQVEKSSGFNIPLPRPTGMNVPPASDDWQPPLHGGVKVILLKSAVPRGVTPHNLQHFEIIVNPFLGGVFGKISSLSTTTWKKRIAWAVRSWLAGLSQKQIDMLFKL